MSQEKARDVLWNAFDARYRPEMRRMERSLLLNQLDTAWKNHLYTMDHLRSGIGLVGYAQEDPKIKYKQEGMKEFKAMWEAMEDKVTDTVFRMEETEAFQESVWVIGATRHDAAPRVTAAAAAAIDERRRATRSRSRSATARRRSAATTRARAAAARSTRTATCARRRCSTSRERKAQRFSLAKLAPLRVASSDDPGKDSHALAAGRALSHRPDDPVPVAGLPRDPHRPLPPRPRRQAARPLPIPSPSGRPVWFHGVSVGEIHLLRQVIAAFRRRRPDRPCVVSTTTDAGHDEARRCFPDLAVFFYPFDFSWAVRRTLRRVDPALIVLAEGEMWPNFLLAARRQRRPGRRDQRPHESAQCRPLPPAAAG